jgi:DNA-binding MarR family transcriptional regulator
MSSYSDLKWYFSPTGFFCLPRPLREDTRLSHAEFRVLVVIGSFVYAENVVFPTRKLLSDMTGIKPSNISRATNNLERLGWIEKKHGFNKAVRYTLRQQHISPKLAVVEEANDYGDIQF